MHNEPNLLQPEEGRRLAGLLGEELTHYRRLVRLAPADEPALPDKHCSQCAPADEHERKP